MEIHAQTKQMDDAIQTSVIIKRIAREMVTGVLTVSLNASLNLSHSSLFGVAHIYHPLM